MVGIKKLKLEIYIFFDGFPVSPFSNLILLVLHLIAPEMKDKLIWTLVERMKETRGWRGWRESNESLANIQRWSQRSHIQRFFSLKKLQVGLEQGRRKIDESQSWKARLSQEVSA
jgi:hypothetical protein